MMVENVVAFGLDLQNGKPKYVELWLHSVMFSILIIVIFRLELVLLLKWIDDLARFTSWPDPTVNCFKQFRILASSSM